MKKKKKKEVTPLDHVATEQADSDFAKDTVASILRSLGQFALPTVSFPVDEFSQKCEQLALEVLIKSGIDEQSGLPRDTRKTHQELRQLVRQQRKSESKEYTAHRESAHIIVADLVTKLRKSLVKKDGHDKEIVNLLSEMEKVVKSGDLRSIHAIATRTATRIRDVLASQRQQEETQLQTFTEQLREMRQELEEAKLQAERDPLTELLNRGSFDKALKETVHFCQALGTPITLYMMDLDHFKEINDTHGHQVGDEVLKKVSRELIRCFPRKDDMVARYGGEEFVALCRDVDQRDAPMLGERARQGIENLEIETDDSAFNPTISIGYAVLGQDEHHEDLLRRADEALYEAKNAGRNRVVFSV
ncbi:MAG: diguanylate cyclase [Proteobacteria bacterium]|nr:diguanylate cyclase [Pseudomonadota bacterium]